MSSDRLYDHLVYGIGLARKAKGRQGCSDFLLRASRIVEEAESPVEEMMALGLAWFGDSYDVTAQERVGERRVDFVLRFKDSTLAVEVDGHDFHERTKEQAQRDKARDRALLLAGYPVIRFTGSEVYENPYLAAAEALDVLEAMAGEQAV